MNMTAQTKYSKQALSNIIDPKKPEQKSFTKLGFDNFKASMDNYQTGIDGNAERRYAIENADFYGDIYLPLANRHKGRG